MTEATALPLLPKGFAKKRIHSLMGVWLVLFLMEHLLTNSQAALFVGDDGIGFVRAVNFIKELPYLPVIEMTLLGLPLLVHGVWGIQTIFTAKYNVAANDGSTPSLKYGGNQAYTWQRWTAWILLFGIIAHVIQMRILNYPTEVHEGNESYYLIRLDEDTGLFPLSERLGFSLISEEQRMEFITNIENEPKLYLKSDSSPEEQTAYQMQRGAIQFAAALQNWPLGKGQVIAAAPSFGTAELLIVRDTFKSGLMIFLYTVLVLATCFHACNGLWSAMITWGVTLSASSQYAMRFFAVGLMTLLSFLGLAAIFGTYWINLYD